MGARILVIEDNPQNLRLMTYLLTSFGHTTTTAVDGQAGLAAARADRFDLVLCDILMPVLDGYEVARVFKADERLQATPIIAVTALAMVGDRERILSAGFDGYISKPIDPQLFVREVDGFLPEALRSR